MASGHLIENLCFQGSVPFAPLWLNCAAWETPRGWGECPYMLPTLWASRTHHPRPPPTPHTRPQAATEPCPCSPGRGAEQRPPRNRTCLYQVGGRAQGEHKQRPGRELRAAVGHRTRSWCGEGLQAFAAGFAQRREGMVRPQAKLTDCRCWSPVVLDGSGTGLSAFPLQTPILHGVGVGGGVVQFTPGPKTWDLNPGSFPLKCCLH